MVEGLVLVDSSIWIEGLAPRAPEAIVTALSALVKARRIASTAMVHLEVLAGAKSHKELDQFRDDFASLACLETTSASWHKAEEIGFLLARRGLHIPAADLLIAAVAISHEVPLWHADKDFERIKHIMPDFNTYWYPQQRPPL